MDPADFQPLVTAEPVRNDDQTEAVEQILTTIKTRLLVNSLTDCTHSMYLLVLLGTSGKSA